MPRDKTITRAGAKKPDLSALTDDQHRSHHGHAGYALVAVLLADLDRRHVPTGCKVSTALAYRGIYHKSQPTAQDCFREKTGSHAKMAGVQYAKFTCQACGKSKPVQGRKRASKHLRDGYNCAECAGGRRK